MRISDWSSDVCSSDLARPALCSHPNCEMAAPMSSIDAAPVITADSIVGETMHVHPATTAVFFRRRMHCPGCHMSGLMTVREAAASYGRLVYEMLSELRPPPKSTETRRVGEEWVRTGR